MTKEEVEKKKKEILERRKEMARVRAYHIRYYLADMKPVRKGTHYFIDLDEEQQKKYKNCYAVYYTEDSIDEDVEAHYAEDLTEGDEETVMSGFYQEAYFMIDGKRFCLSGPLIDEEEDGDDFPALKRVKRRQTGSLSSIDIYYYGAYFMYKKKRYLLSAVFISEKEYDLPVLKRVKEKQTGCFSFTSVPVNCYLLPIDKIKIVPTFIDKELKFNEEDMKEIERLDPNYKEWFEDHPNIKKIRENTDLEILDLAEENLNLPCVDIIDFYE